MRSFNFTNGKKETLKVREISNRSQSIYSENELIRVFFTDNLSKHENENLDTRLEIVIC